VVLGAATTLGGLRDVFDLNDYRRRDFLNCIKEVVGKNHEGYEDGGERCGAAPDQSTQVSGLQVEFRILLTSSNTEAGGSIVQQALEAIVARPNAGQLGEE